MLDLLAIKGDTGAKGATGATGATGPQGPAGPAGQDATANFNVAADDSTQIKINNGETVKFIGGTGVNTSSSPEGYITIDASLSLNDLTNVNISGTPSNGQVLKYDSGLGEWTNAADATGAGGSGIGLGDLSVTVSGTPSGSGNLTYNSGTGVFTFTQPDLSSYLTSSSLTGYATQSYVTSQGYITTSSLSVTTNPAGANALSYSNGVFTFTPYSYTLPNATTSTLGGVIVGSGLSVSSGTISLTHNTITVNGTSIALGSSRTITATATNSLTVSTGLSLDSGTTYNGSAARTITNTGVTSIVAGTGISVSGATGAVTVSVNSGANVQFVNVTSTGILYSNQVIETFQTYSTTISGSPVVAFDATSGQIVNVTGTISSNFTANFTNLSLTSGKASNCTVILNQGVTPYIVSAFQIGGVAQTINWQGNITPTGNASKKDAFAFTILCTASNTYTVFGQMVTFG